VNVLGIDPGVNGGFAILKNGHYTIGEAIPKDDGKLCFLTLCKRLQKYQLSFDHIVIERVHSIQGTSAKSNFMFGRNYQACLSAALLQNKPMYYVKPTEWVKYMHSDVPLITKATKAFDEKKDTKAMSLVKAQRLWPDADFTKNERARKPHDGIIDAALIAYYITDQLQNKINR
jgi:hypothetical protein